MAGRRFIWVAIAAAVIAAAAVFIWQSDRLPTTDMAFAMPVDCVIGETCFVQNYVDVDPGPDARDFTCGDLTYDGHKGVDFGVPDLDAMARGVAVLAAAPGIVLRVRDGVDDGFPEDIEDAAVEGAECGNGLIIDHGDGWETQYCHMRKGSVLVAPEQQVAAGERLGLVGLSGKTEFPHLHISVRHQGAVVDPYVGAAPPVACGGETKPLWNEAAQRLIGYRVSGVINTGFTTEPPTLRSIETGEAPRLTPASDTNLIFYVRFFGLRSGDSQRFRLFGPGDVLLARTETQPAEKHKARWLQFIGKRAPLGGWQPGTYRGSFELVRDGDVVLSASQALDVH